MKDVAEHPTRLWGLILVGILVMTSCGRGERKPASFKVVSWLYDCSPFESLDANRSLMFKPADGTILLYEAANEDRGKGAFSVSKARKTVGTFTVDEAMRNVSVAIGEFKADYTFILTPGFQCLLISGSVKSADLSSSWFGEPDLSEQ
jgi:hypothetical protein